MDEQDKKKEIRKKPGTHQYIFNIDAINKVG